MIELTRLNGTKFTINAELIESLEGAPKSTVVNLATSNRYIVSEEVKEIVERVVAYRKRVNSERAVINPIQGFERE